MNRNVHLRNLAGLLGEADDNPEYDRAIGEVGCLILSVNMDNKEDVLVLLRNSDLLEAVLNLGLDP